MTPVEPMSGSPSVPRARGNSRVEDERDERLAGLLAQMTEGLRRGKTPDLEALARQNPDVADELRELWTAVRFAEELRVDGRIDGKIVSESGRLLVGETGYVEAEIRVGGASISGTVSGTLLATKRVEIHSTGKFYGNIHCPALIIEEGAVFEGNCAMASSRRPCRQ